MTCEIVSHGPPSLFGCVQDEDVGSLVGKKVARSDISHIRTVLQKVAAAAAVGQ